MSMYLTEDLLHRWQEEYAKRKEPIDTDIKKREKTAGDPPKDAMPNPEKGGPGSAPNPDNSTAPSRPQRGSKDADSTDDGEKPDINRVQWYMGSYSLEPELDPHTGLAKWPLSFRRVEKDTKRPNKPVNPGQDTPKNHKQEQPPTAV